MKKAKTEIGMPIFSEEELEILEAFRKFPFKEFTIQDIQTAFNKKSYAWTYNCLNKFTEHYILVHNKVGKINVFKLNFSIRYFIKYFSIIDLKYLSKIPELTEIFDLIRELAGKNIDFVCLLFGSYAKNQQSATSDIDLLIMAKDDETLKKYKPVINQFKLLKHKNYDIQLFSYDMFQEMLTNDEENLGKQIARHNLLIYGDDVYYSLLTIAYNKGFKG